MLWCTSVLWVGEYTLLPGPMTSRPKPSSMISVSVAMAQLYPNWESSLPSSAETALFRYSDSNTTSPK